MFGSPAPQGDLFGGMPSGGGAPLQLNTGSKKGSSYKRRKSSAGAVTMTMMVVTLLWLLTMPVIYLWITSSGEAHIAQRQRGGVIMTSDGETVRVGTVRGIFTFGAICWGVVCPTGLYGMIMLVLVVILLVVKSSENKQQKMQN